MTETENFNDIYLNLTIRKSEQGKTDENGNYYFEVEASNENIDLQDQIVLQNALMESKDEFLRGGVISYDHLHKTRDAVGNPVSDPSMVIGEPVDVKFDTKTRSTIVKGKLYKTNEKAREIINMLKAGSTRVRASVGGIFPKIIKDAKTGVEKVTHVLWNDLALTVSPVNNTVGSAVFAKSLTSQEFVNSLPLEIKKSLYAGYGTDSTTFAGGRALIPEDTNTEIIENTETNTDGLNSMEEQAVRDMCTLLSKGELIGENAAIDYLVVSGIKEDKARRIVREIINQGGRGMVKKSFTSSLNGLFKSLTGKAADDDDIKKGKSEEEENTDDDISLDDDDDIKVVDDDDAANDDESNDDDDKNKDDDDDEMVDGSEVLKSLDSELGDIRKSIQMLKEQAADLGGALEVVGKMVCQVGGQEIPPSSVINKSLSAGSAKAVQNGRPTIEDFYQVQDVLTKCVKAGTIDIRKSSMISSDVQKCMKTGEPMKKEYFEFLQRELKGAN